jgi:hypothetical protein
MWSLSGVVDEQEQTNRARTVTKVAWRIIRLLSASLNVFPPINHTNFVPPNQNTFHSLFRSPSLKAQAKISCF